MTSLSKWNPLRELDEIQSRITGLLGRSLLKPEAAFREPVMVSEWSPLVDITEDEKEFLIKVELPEVKRDDIKVTVENGVLSIAGERKFEKEEQTRKYHRVERSYGSFLRSFTLPEGTGSDKVNAEYRDGILTITLPKAEESKPRQIGVKVG
ncbi:MAG: Hsp20/alpha crystallin family protein [Rhodobacteraceae bacterium]|nr:Hsp20/alpha crystallin family protein [Paracoccaceae bacterium]